MWTNVGTHLLRPLYIFMNKLRPGEFYQTSNPSLRNPVFVLGIYPGEGYSFSNSIEISYPFMGPEYSIIYMVVA